MSDAIERLQDVDPELDQWVASARDIYGSAVEDDDAFADVAAMLARAHELDAEAVPAQMVQDGKAIDFEARDSAVAGDDLGEFVAAYQEVVEAAEVEAPVTGMLEARAPAPSRRTGWLGWVASVAAAGTIWIWAGTAVAAIAVATWAFRVEPWNDEVEVSEAPQQRSAPAASPMPAPKREPKRRRRAAPKPAPEPDPAPEDAPKPATEPESAAPSARTRVRRPDVMAQRNAEALRLWKAGDLAGAERLFRQTIRTGRGRYVQLAYGDLSTLVRQRHGRQAQEKLWNEYLRRFPKGRFSDDWSAGLCRRRTGVLRTTCWAKYRRKHPNGAHVAEAREAP